MSRYRISYSDRAGRTARTIVVTIDPAIVARDEYIAVRTEAEKHVLFQHIYTDSGFYLDVASVERMEGGVWRARRWPVPVPVRFVDETLPACAPFPVWPSPR